VFEIGSSLREERLRRGIELTQVAADTCIRARYLRALEEGRFDLLPGTAYVRGFLRTYASYLGLDEERFVHEYNVHFAPVEELPITPLRAIERHPLHLPAAVAVLLAAAAVAVLAWTLGRSGGEPRHVINPTPPAKTAAPIRSASAPTGPRRAEPTKLLLTAARGPCWLLAHLGTEQGRQLYMGTLEQGRSLRLAGGRLWIRFGAPQNLDATVNARPVGLPNDTADVVVTAQAVRTVERG
jgi:transcriptional regulator with XRE-family HTH domain